MYGKTTDVLSQDKFPLIIEEENLNRAEAYKFVKNAFRDGSIPVTGTAITTVLPPTRKFDRDSQRSKIKENVLKKLKEFFDRFFDISGGMFN